MKSKEINGVNRKVGGATLTKVAREHTLKNLSLTLKKDGLNVSSLHDLKARHIERYIEIQKQNGITDRTLQNRMTHIRNALNAIGRAQLAGHERLSSAAMKINNASREGKHEAISKEKYHDVMQEAAALGKPEVMAAIELQRVFGLRAGEAIEGFRSLPSWLKQLESGKERVTVIYGTKGGRIRDSAPIDKKMGVEVIKRAIAALEPKTGRLIRSASLEGAKRSYLRDCTKVGLHGVNSSHSLRYAYAQDLKTQALARGLSEHEARAQVSLELGHGDGRGTYVEQVYAQR
jgi:hypothetical protein